MRGELRADDDEAGEAVLGVRAAHICAGLSGMCTGASRGGVTAREASTATGAGTGANFLARSPGGVAARDGSKAGAGASFRSAGVVRDRGAGTGASFFARSPSKATGAGTGASFLGASVGDEMRQEGSKAGAPGARGGGGARVRGSGRGGKSGRSLPREKGRELPREHGRSLRSGEARELVGVGQP